MPHAIADYDTDLIQLNVWTGTKWVNIFDGNDMNNLSIDLHRVAKVVDDQVIQIKDAVKRADDAVKQAGKAVDDSATNKQAIEDVNKAVDEAKQSASDALDRIKNLATGSAIQDIQNSIKQTTDDVTKLRDDQVAQLKNVTGQINDAVAQAKAAADSLNAKTEALQSAVKNVQSDATVATQTASEANITAIDAKGDAAVAMATAKQVTVDMKNVQNDILAAKATASEATITAGNAASDAITAKTTASAASVTATDAKSDVAEVKATAQSISSRMSAVESDTDKRIAANSTAIEQNKSAITLKADQSSIDKLDGEMSSATAQLEVQAGQISSKAESTELKKVSDKADSAQSDAKAASTKADSAIASAAKNTTAIDQNSKAIALKADQTTVDKINKTATDNSAAVNVLNNEIKLKVDSTTVNKMIDDKGFTTAKQAQALVDQSATKLSSTITELKTTVDNNGSLINSTNDRLTNVTQAIDGLQTTVKDKANQSQITQLANALQVKLSGSIIAQATDVTLTYTGKENEYPPAAPLAGMNDVDKGSTLILSFDYVASDDTKLTPQLDGDPWVPWGTIVNATPAAKGKKGSYSMTITVNDDSWQKGNAKNLCIRCDGFKGTIEITNLVLKYADTTLHDVQSSFDMLRDDINLRVTKGKLISQINLEAGRTLIQSSKIYLDADSVVFGENSKAFIPSAYITDINAEKITTGILKSISINNGDGAFTVTPSGDVVANSIKVRNGNFYQGDIFGANIYAIMRDKDQRAFSSLDDVDEAQDNWFKINGDILEWHQAPDEYASIGPSLNYVKDNHSPDDHDYTGTTLGLTIVGTKGITLSTGDQAKWVEDDPTVGTYKDPIKNIQNLSWANETRLEILQDHIQVNLGNGGDLSDGSIFNIQKDDYLTAKFGDGSKKNEIQFTTQGRQGFHSLNEGVIYFDRNEHGATHDGLNNFLVFGNLNVTQGQKNSLVKTSQGWAAVHAYETAEYYFGDIGENNTGANGKVIVGLDQLFAQTINTDMQYQVFITPYNNAHVWVSQRLNNRFVVESDQPNAEFGWEIKGHRKEYEHSRLTNFSQSMN